MKKVHLLLLPVVILFVSCSQSIIGPDLTSFLAGSYQLVDYRSPTVVDLIPSGVLTITQMDNQHVFISVQGTVGKTKISYALSNVLVTNIDQTTSSLTLKGKSVGQMVDNGASLYVTLTPAKNVTIGAMVF